MTRFWVLVLLALATVRPVPAATRGDGLLEEGESCDDR
jgi:hypothetical protein